MISDLTISDIILFEGGGFMHFIGKVIRRKIMETFFNLHSIVYLTNKSQ